MCTKVYSIPCSGNYIYINIRPPSPKNKYLFPLKRTKRTSLNNINIYVYIIISIILNISIQFKYNKRDLFINRLVSKRANAKNSSIHEVGWVKPSVGKRVVINGDFRSRKNCYHGYISIIIRPNFGPDLSVRLTAGPSKTIKNIVFI